jgi:hypothetical protein
MLIIDLHVKKNAAAHMCVTGRAARHGCEKQSNVFVRRRVSLAVTLLGLAWPQ